MTESHPYPDAEQWQKPATVGEALVREAAQYAAQPNPQQSMGDLHEIYRPTRIGKDFARAAMLMRLSKILLSPDDDISMSTDSEPTESTPFMRDTAKLNRDFYVGSMLALHSVYNLVPAKVRLTLIHKEFFSKSYPEDQPIHQDDPLLLEVAEKMEDFRRNQWMPMAEKLLPPSHVNAILDAATLLYPDTVDTTEPELQEAQVDFMAGYTFACYNLYQIMESIDQWDVRSAAHSLPYMLPV